MSVSSILDISPDAIKGKLLSIQSTGYYAQLEPKEIKGVYNEAKTFVKYFGSSLTQLEEYSIMELLFHLTLYMSYDLECEKIYKQFFDKFGNNSPYMHYFRSLLQQINNYKKIENGVAEDSMVVEKSIESLIEEILEVETDQIDYLLMCKRFISMKKHSISGEMWIKLALGLVEKFPMDTELWYQLGLEYFNLKNYDQARYCLEEVVLLTPYNYVAWCTLGEVIYYKALSVKSANLGSSSSGCKTTLYLLRESLKNFLKSVEYSENFMKSWCYITKITEMIIELNTKNNNSNDNKHIDNDQTLRLFELGKSKLKLHDKKGFMNEKDAKVCKFILSNLK